MSTQQHAEAFAGDSGPLLGTRRTTGKLLAMQGYVVGIEISGSGARQTVALSDLNGMILHRVCRPLDYVPDSETVLELIDEMLDEVMAPERLQDGRVLRVGVAVGGLVDATRGVVRTLYHAHGWNDFPLQDYFAERSAPVHVTPSAERSRRPQRAPRRRSAARGLPSGSTHLASPQCSRSGHKHRRCPGGRDR